MANLQPYAIGALFAAAGTLHFTNSAMYESIVPPYLPAHKTLVAASGVFEVLGGLGAMVPATRRFSGWGLIALLLAVFPANIYMATDAGKFSSFAPSWALYARLPLQLVMIVWIFRVCCAASKPNSEDAAS